MRRSSKKSELVLLLLPCLFLGGVAVALRHKAGARFTLPDNRFRLTVNRIEFFDNPYETHHDKRSWFGRSGHPPKRARALYQNEQILTMYVFVDHLGQAPKWWLDDSNGRPDMDLTSVIFTDKNHKQTQYPAFYCGSGRDIYSSMPRYNIVADCYVPKGISLKGSTITATVWVEHAGTVRFSAPVNDTNKDSHNVFAPITTPGIQNLETTPASR